MALVPRPGQRLRHTPGLIDGLRPLADTVVLSADRPHAAPEPTLFRQDFAPRGLQYHLRWDHRCFFQVNTLQNAQLIALVLDLLPAMPTPATALDLYCGMGNFSLPLAMTGLTVTGIEQNRASIHWAQTNSRAAGLTDARFLAGDVERRTQALAAADARFDLILLDPPRQGAGKAAALLPLLRPAHILSISCDPATLARDLSLIVPQGYRITRLIPVDMFPQTHHIESVALLERI